MTTIAEISSLSEQRFEMFKKHTLVCQFIEISNQMELTCEVSSFEYKNLYNALCAMEFAEPTRNFGNGGASKLSYLQMC